MRVLVQRVTKASVAIDGAVVGGIGFGLLILVCAMQGDTYANAAALAAKIGKLRIFSDPAGKMNLSLTDISGQALVVSQFTLAADTSRGNRPGFSSAASPDEGRVLYEYFVDQLRKLGIDTATGRFGTDMAVHLVNDGPVTIWMDM